MIMLYFASTLSLSYIVDITVSAGSDVCVCVITKKLNKKQINKSRVLPEKGVCDAGTRTLTESTQTITIKQLCSITNTVITNRSLY